jgi:hypothetical protein
VKLSGIAAALGAGLGIAGEAEAGQSDGMLQFKFYTAPDRAGKQELLFATRVSPAIQKRITAAGMVQVKIEQAAAGNLLPAVQRPIILGAATIQIKGEASRLPGILQDKHPR